jgi:hypothetical protein
LQSSGTYSCSDATNGTYRADGLQVDENGLYSAAFYRKKAGTTAEIKEVHAGSGALAATTSAGASIPQPGLWIVDAEATGKPGRGFQIDLQNRTLVFTYYGYKFGGAPTFFLASGPLTDAGSFEAQLMEYQGGTTLGGPQQDAVAKNSAGLVSVRFVSPTAGLITFPGEPEKSISRFSFADTSVRLKSGNFDGVTYGISSSPDSTKFTFSLSNGSLTLTRAATIAGTCTFNGTYTLAGTALQSSGTYSCSDATNGTYRADGLQVDENGLYSAAFYRKKTGTTAEIKEVHAGSSALAPAALITTLPRMRGFQIGANAGWSNKADSRWQNLSSATESGANVVRLFLEQYEPTTGAAFPGATLTDRVNASLNSYGDLVETLLAKNMIVILALDTYFTYPASHTWPDDGATLWSNPKAQQEVVDMWASLATRYKGRSGLIFDLMNEPHGVSAAELKDDHLVARTQWDALSKRTISVVSQTDSQRSMLVEPIWGEAPYLKYLTPSDNARVIYSFHYYNPHNFTHQGIPGWPAAGTVNYPSTTRDKDTAPLKIWDKTTVQNDLQVAKDFAVKNNVRVVLGEAGVMRSAPAADRLSWATDVLGVAESMGFDVVWFQYDGWGVPSTFRTGWSWENSELDSLLRDFFKKN